MSTHGHSNSDPPDRDALRWSAAREATWPGEIAAPRPTSPPPNSATRSRQDTAEARSVLARYTLGPEIGRGGMATVHLGTHENASGFRRPVAIKRVRATLASSAEAWDRLRCEGFVGAAIRHPNVVSVHDLVVADDEVWVVMEYVLGETLGHLLKVDRRPPLAVVSAIMTGVLRGLHAAHNATGPNGGLLGLVHRDVSPQNILVGADGFARVLDFGVAKSLGSEATRVGHVKGKVGYFAPEQLLDESVSPSTDIFATGIVLWEAVTGRRMFGERDVLLGMEAFMTLGAEAPSLFNCEIPSALDAVLGCALERSPKKRFRNAEDFAIALERVIPAASPSQVSRYLKDTFSSSLGSQRSLLHGSGTSTDVTRVDGGNAADSSSRQTVPSVELDEKTELMKPAAALLDAMDAAHDEDFSAPGAKPPSTRQPGPEYVARPLVAPFARTRPTSRVKLLGITAIAFVVLAGAWLIGRAVSGRNSVEPSVTILESSSPTRKQALPPPSQSVGPQVHDVAPGSVRVEDLPLLAPAPATHSERKRKKGLARGD